MNRSSAPLRVFLLTGLLVISSVVASAQRLPGGVTPEHYSLKFTPDLKTDSFTGEETIQVRIEKPTKSITLHALDLSLNEISITSAGNTQKATASFDKASQTAALNVPNEIAAGPAQIHIRFSAPLNKDLRGFYLSQADGKKYAVTQFESTDARRAFPCFDEPALKATFDVTVVAPKGLMAISNMKAVSDEPGPTADQHTVKFETTPKLSTYLVAMLIGDFACIEDSSDGIPIRVCAPPPNEKLGHFAMDVAKFSGRT